MPEPLDMRDTLLFNPVKLVNIIKNNIENNKRFDVIILDMFGIETDSGFFDVNKLCIKVIGKVANPNKKFNKL